jgi:hypothetical protein
MAESAKLNFTIRAKDYENVMHRECLFNLLIMEHNLSFNQCPRPFRCDGPHHNLSGFRAPLSL